MPSSSPLSSYLKTLHEYGFVKVAGLLSADQVLELREACKKAADQARAGSWPYIRTLPKQFPPWPTSPPPEGIWGVQHLLHPDMPARHVFAASYFNARLLSIAQEILGVNVDDVDGVDRRNDQNGTNGGHVHGGSVSTAGGGGDGDGEEKLVMELYNLLVRPDSDFELRWHRDDIPPSASPDEERRALGVAADGSQKAPVYSHTQWNLALETDESLIVVPGSHKRARTEIERKAGIHDTLPNQLVVHLDPGDAVFYDNDILHRGKYDASKERFTLHGSMGKKGFTDKRARNVLQHGVGEWIQICNVDLKDEALSRRARAMKNNLIKMGTIGDVGYSQAD